MLTDEQIDEITELGLKTYEKTYDRLMGRGPTDQAIVDNRASWFAMQAMSARIQSILSSQIPLAAMTSAKLMQ